MMISDRRPYWVIFMIMLVAVGGTMGIDIHLPSMPAIMKALHTDKAHVQQSVSLYVLGAALSMLVYGPLSDRYGRRPIVIFGLSLTTLTSVASVFTHHVGTFLFTRILQGIGAGVCSGLGRTMVVDVLQGDRLAGVISYFSMIVGLSMIVAPTIGGYLQHWFGWQANFIALALFVGGSLLCYIKWCPETNLQKNPSATRLSGLLINYKLLFTSPIFVGCLLIAGLVMASLTVFSTISSFLFQMQYGLTPVSYGWVMAFIGFGGVVGRLINPLLIRWTTGLTTMGVGLYILLSGAILLLVVSWFVPQSVHLIVLSIFLVLISRPLILPGTTTRALSPHHDKRGTAGAIYGSFQMLIAALSSMVVAGLEHDGIMILVISYLLIAILSLVLFYTLVKRRTSW